jgi:signal transduction histidine kinase
MKICKPFVLTVFLASVLLLQPKHLFARILPARMDSLVQLLEQARDTSRIDLLITLSEELNSSQSKQAFVYAREALTMAQELRDTVRTGDAYKAMAGVYKVNAVYEKSLEYLLLSLRQFESIKDTTKIAECNDEIGTVYMMSNDFTNARNYFQKAFDLNKKIRNFPQIALNYMNMGSNYLMIDSIEKGLSYYLVSLMIADSLQMEEEKITLMNHIGYGYARLGKHEDALKHYYKVLELIGENPDEITRANAMVNIAKGYYSIKNYPAALKYARNAYELSKSNDFNQVYRDASKILSDIYAAQGNYYRSYRYLKEYKNISDTIMNVEKAEQLAKIQTLYELDIKEQENNILRQENQKAKRSLQTRTLVLFLITTLVIVLAVLLYMLNKLNNKQLELNKKLSEQGHELQKLNDEKDKFFSFVAHNLKNPFNTIMGFAELMQRTSESTEPEKARQYSSLIYELSSQVQRVLGNLLEWSRLQRRSFECKPETLELTGLIKDVLEMNNKEAARKDIHINITDEGSMYVSADRAMITTVLQNLLSNAINYTPPSGRISIESRITDQQAEVSISDTGIGISKENLSRLFHFDYSQAKIVATDNGGAGLGLVICREMINKNGGTIFAESERGKGSRFTFKLPAIMLKETAKGTTERPVAKVTDVTGDLLATNGNIPKEIAAGILIDLAPQFDEVSRVLSIENLELFSKLVIESGEKYGITALSNYGKSLASLTHAHQIDQIIRILPRFREYLDKLEGRH